MAVHSECMLGIFFVSEDASVCARYQKQIDELGVYRGDYLVVCQRNEARDLVE